MTRALVPLAQGCEELEAVTIIDILRRGGVEVVSAGLDAAPVVASRGTGLLPDVELAAVLDQDFDLIALPGGLPGATNLNADARLHTMLRRQVDAGRWCAAICAAPLVLANAGLLSGRTATSYPGALNASDYPDIHLSLEPVVTDGPIVTSQGPGTAMDFALHLVQILRGREIRQEVEAKLMRPMSVLQRGAD
jgi:4-methyl-5(b-hydroxyethyl)-thiazole monophosphate biosynthesis